MVTDAQIVDLIQREVVPALGCTEPIAVALACAKAREVLGVLPDEVQILVSGNILKNSMAVGVPGTGMKGLPIAAALGLVGGDSSLDLEVISQVTPEQIAEAKAMVERKVCSIHLKENTDPLYIECHCMKGENHAAVIINHMHTNIVEIVLNGEIILKQHEIKDEPAAERLEGLTVQRIWEFTSYANLEDIDFIWQGAIMNKAISDEGLSKPYGMQVGRKMKKNIELGIFGDDLINRAILMTSAGADARMDGSTCPVMSNSGSGNQGITTFLPVIAVAEKLKKGKEETIRALILSNLIAIHMKSYLGRLSALCGVVVAATGSACGAAYLLSANYDQIVATIKNMIGGITGMICDGAKVGCSLKISAGVSAAIQSAMLAIDGVEISSLDGIIEDDIEQTIKNFGEIGSSGMLETDRLILHQMSCK